MVIGFHVPQGIIYSPILDADNKSTFLSTTTKTLLEGDDTNFDESFILLKDVKFRSNENPMNVNSFQDYILFIDKIIGIILLPADDSKIITTKI